MKKLIILLFTINICYGGSKLTEFTTNSASFAITTLGLTHQTNFPQSAITNSTWITNNSTGAVIGGVVLTNNNLTAPGVICGLFSGNGASLTNLDASQLLSGTVPNARMPAAVITNNWSQEAGAIALTNTVSVYSNGVAGVTLSGNGKLLVGGAAAGADAVNVTGSIRSSAGATFTGTMSSTYAGISQTGYSGGTSDATAGYQSASWSVNGGIWVAKSGIFGTTITSTNGVVIPTNATPPALTISGCQIFCDSTGPCIVFRNGATLTTNRISLTTYP